MNKVAVARGLGLACACILVSSCGGGGGSGGGGGTGGTGGGGGSTPTAYTIGGTLSGLDTGSVVLQNNGGDDLTVSANGTFQFVTSVATGAGYAVTVKTQPSGGPLQLCSVMNGSGTVAKAAVTNVTVTCVARVAKFLYVTNTASQNLSGYAIDASTGMLTEMSGSPFPTEPVPFYVTADPTGKYAYVTSRGSSTVPPRISAYTLNSTSGALTALAFSPYDLSVPPPPAGALSISPPLLHPSGAFGYISTLYLNTSLTPPIYSQLFGATLNSSTGELTQIPGMPINLGSNSAYGVFDSAGKFFFVGNNTASAGVVLAYQVNSPSGVLTSLGSVSTGGTSPLVVLVPGDRFLLATNFQSATIVAFSVSASGGLTMVENPVATGPTGSLSGPAIYHRRLNVVYVTNYPSPPPPQTPTTPPSLAAFRFDTTTGSLTPLAGSPYSSNGSAGGAFLHPSGKFLYQVSGGTLQRYSIDQTSGVPSLLADVTTLNDTGPHTVIPDPSGRFLYVTGNVSSSGGAVSISVYSVDATTGALTLVITRSAGTAAQNLQAFPNLIGLQ